MVKPRTGGAQPWTRFFDANQRFCRRHLKPRLYPVSHLTALNCWFERRVPTVPSGASLEFGCGEGLPLTRLVGNRFGERCATDIEPVPADLLLPGVTFEPCTSTRIPFADAAFDVVLIRSVIEHLEDPVLTFSELNRVTKPGGLVFMNLPNKWDYVSVVARLSGSLKSGILNHVVRTNMDDYPVHYRCNTRRALTRVADRTGFDVVEFLPLPSQPSYLAFFVPFYLLGVLYQVWIGMLGLDGLQPSFVVSLRKRGTGEEGRGSGIRQISPAADDTPRDRG